MHNRPQPASASASSTLVTPTASGACGRAHEPHLARSLALRLHVRPDRHASSSSAVVAAVVCVVTESSAAAYVQHADVCANRLCTRDKPHVPRCASYRARPTLTAEQRKVRCFVFRAARHYRWSQADALYVSFRESRWTELGTNYAGFRGPFQMSFTLMGLTPYRAHDRNEARWAALAFAYLSARRGLRCSWSPPAYCQ